jgi:transposase
VKKGRLRNQAEAFRKFFGEFEEMSAVVEACRNWPVAVELLREVTQQITLAHPYKTRIIAEAKIKTDKIASEDLAQLLRMDWIPTAYLRSPENLALQRVVRLRCFEVKLQTMLKNRIHILLDGQRPEIREGVQGFSDVFGKQGIEWMKNLVLEGKDHELLQSLLIIYETIHQQIRASEPWFKSLVQKDPVCGWVYSLPGLGYYLAVLVRVEVGEIERFRSPDKFCRYAGLVPSTYSSGGKTSHGALIKQGNTWLRWAMVEAVLGAIRSSPELRSYYLRYQDRGNYVARVATARYLLKILYHILKEQRPFIPKHGAAFSELLVSPSR